jgi:predicted nucleic-acid-binding Zn-ribbon protein
MEGLGALSGIVSILILIAVILAFLMPFFVLRIRNEIISMNQKMAELVKILGGTNKNYSNVELTKSGRKLKKCMQCGTLNRYEDDKCMNCGAPLP